jgi:hypothetical protein
MSPSRWAPIEQMIRDFQGLLAPSVPQLKIEKGVDCAEAYPTSEAASPALKKRGVYLIFDDSESKIYIGVTIDRQLIARCLEHRKGKRCGLTPRWIDVIPFDPEWEFFAPSLEVFLIDRIVRLEECIITSVNKRGASRAHTHVLKRLLRESEELD